MKYGETFTETEGGGGPQIGNKSIDKTEFENPLVQQNIFGHVTKNGAAAIAQSV